jgi:site-specific DNA-methyltransferase (adenine-specific)
MNQVIHGDCLIEMQKIPDKSIDCVITDPPYGITKEKWDTLPTEQYFDEIFRISKNQIIFGANYFNLPPSRGILCWDKVMKKVGYLSIREIDEFELIWTSFSCKAKILRYTFVGNMQGWCDEPLKVDYTKGSGKKHSTQKPIPVMEYLIKKFTKEGDTIFDPFAGSGTTGVACKNLNRNYILIEKEQEYIDIINKRLL